MNASIARSELILGGQKSGKSRRAELLARAWLAQSPAHRAVLIATAQAHDDEMRARIARHRRERAGRVPGMATVEEPRDLAAALARHGAAGTLVVIDCLTLWLTHWLMPMEYEPNRPPALDWQALTAINFDESSVGRWPAADPPARAGRPAAARSLRA